jgi:alpha-tubulin suppressor-like RCC1 family protein
VAASGAGYCWGQDYYGQLGDGSPLGGDDRRSPVAVTGGLALGAITAGKAHSCGLTTAGSGYCWGADPAGQLGDGSTTTTSTPVAIAPPK